MHMGSRVIVRWTSALGVVLGIAFSPTAQAFEAEKYYATVCASCHGENGEGDGPAAASLPVKPASFSDANFWSARDDDRIRKVIKEGGAAAGLSPLMGPFGATLSDAELDSLVAYLHTFETKPAPEASKPNATPKTEERSPPLAEPKPEPEHEPTGTEASTHDPSTDGAAQVDQERAEPAGGGQPHVQTATVGVVQVARPDPDPRLGARLYARQCATCHGRHGGGDGPAARFMEPQPRDLSSGTYKFTSIPNGLATEEDLYRIISRGMPGTAMPAWSGLSQEERWQLVYHLRALAPPLPDPTPEPIDIPQMPGATPASVARGAEVYQEAGCIACHGPGGRARGMPVLTDGGGRALRAADLGRADHFRGGGEPTDIYRTITTGIGGTPMPGFAHLAAEDRWALVHWIAAIQTGRPSL